MLLPVENHVKTSLMELAHLNAVRAFRKDLNLVDSRMLLLLLVNPFTFTDGGSRDEAQDLKCCDNNKKIVSLTKANACRFFKKCSMNRKKKTILSDSLLF